MKFPFLSRLRAALTPAPDPSPVLRQASEQGRGALEAEEHRTGMHGPSPVATAAMDAAALDRGRPELAEETARPELIGVRAFWDQTVASGLSPERMAIILRNAIRGDHRPYLELAEEMEERDPHYFSVLGTRKRVLAAVPPAVDAESRKAVDPAVADAVRDLVQEPQFREMLRDLTDALGKGYSVVEVVWGEADGMWRPLAYKWRDPKYFTFDFISRTEVRAQVLGTIDGEALAPAKFIAHIPKLKSGIPIRGGFARIAAWAWMFKSYTLKDWMTFLDVYGMPIRVGKYHPAATPDERRRLLTAVSSIATDAAAIIPESMAIEFIEAKGFADKPFENMGRYLDEQMSKAILGQTLTVESGGSMAQAKVHNLVRIDILRDDVDQLSATLNRDLIRWFVGFNFGAETLPPDVLFPVAEPEDVAALTNALGTLVPLGLEVSMAEVRRKLGFGEPDEGEAVLTAPAAGKVPKPATDGQLDKGWMRRRSPSSGRFAAAFSPQERGEEIALNADAGSTMDEVEAIGETGADDWEPQLAPIVERILQAAERATSFDDFSARLAAMAGEIEADPMAKRLAVATLKTRALGLLDARP